MADYLEGDLALERRALFDAHLDECSECSEEIGAMRATIALLRELPEPEVPPQLANDVMRRIRAGEARAGWLDRLRDIGASLLDPRVLAPASAAMLALGIVLGTGQFRIGGPQPSGEQNLALYAPSVMIGEQSAGRQPGANAPLITAGRPAASANSQITDGRIAVQSPAEGVVGFSVRIQRWKGTPGPVGGGAPSRQAPATRYVDAGQPGQSRNVAIRKDTSAGIPRRTQDDVWSADRWLDHAEHNPAAFAAGLSDAAGTSLAEHELWVKNLALHAVETDRIDEVVRALQRSPNPYARSLARDFEAEGRKVVAVRNAESSVTGD
jgi:hypothetical protein